SGMRQCRANRLRCASQLILRSVTEMKNATSSGDGQRKQRVWVVMHYEIMGRPELPHIDCAQFHVSSTLLKAEAYIRAVSVDAHSWWQIHPHVVDHPLGSDEGDEIYFFSHRGTRLKSAPVQRAIAAYRRHAARHPELFPQHSPDWQ